MTVLKKMFILLFRNSDQKLSLEGPNIFLGKLEVGFWSVWKKLGIGSILWSPYIEQNGEICNLTKNYPVLRTKQPEYLFSCAQHTRILCGCAHTLCEKSAQGKFLECAACVRMGKY